MLRDIEAGSEFGLFEALADTLPALVRICDVNGASIWFNKAWLDFRGRTAEAEAGAGWLEGLHPDDKAANLAALAHHFAEHRTYEIKYRLRHHSGQYRWVLHRAAPRFNDSGVFQGFITACVDIHEATMADHERAHFFDVAGDILMKATPDGEIEDVSPACERVLGWAAAELVGTPLSNLLHPDDVEAMRAAALTLRRGEDITASETRYRHKDGSYRWLSCRARFDSQTGSIFSSALDVTERKMFETELQETVKRYNLAISATSDGIWDWNLQTDVLYMSPRNKEMLGLSASDSGPATATEWRSYLHPDDVAGCVAAYEAYLRGETPEYRTHFRIRHADGDWRILLSRGVALRDETGQACRMLGVHTDITEQRRMEDNLRELKDQAEAANRAKSDFLANMSHEIRTPMNAVIGAAHLLDRVAPLNDKQQKLVGVLNDSARAMMALVNDFLDLSKIESGVLEFAREDFDARHLVTDVLQILDVEASAKGLRLQQQNDCACVNERLFIGDPARIKQILLNLCANAVKFTDAGEVTVEISCQPTETPEVENLIFGISDTGVGIAEDKLARIFEKFEQGDSSVTRRFGGTGLGLSIVKALTSAMGGTIVVQSQLGQGTTFRVTLPLHRSGRKSAATEDMAGSESADLETPKILLVEDLPANVLITQHFLDEFGYRYEVAHNGQQALDRIMAGENFDVVLMDIQMPVMDGREATRRIRAHERRTGSVPNQVIALTAHAMVADRNQCIEAGMDDYLSKPFDPKLLEQKLRRAIAIYRKAQDRFLTDVSAPDDDGRSEMAQAALQGEMTGDKTGHQDKGAR